MVTKKPTEKKLVRLESENVQVVNIHSGAISVENSISILSRKAWFYMVYKAFPYLETQNTFQIPLTELKKAIGYESTNNKYLKESLKELVGTIVEFNIFNKDKTVWEVNSMMAGCKIEKGTGICEYSFSPFLKERLNQPEMYVKLNLYLSKNFKSKHTLSLYCLALDYLQVMINYGTKNVTVDELRKFLGLKKDEYPRVVDINKDILKKAEKEINEKSDLNISITPIRTSNRKILGFKLEMSMKPEYLNFYKNQQKQIEAPKLQEDNKQKKPLISIQNTEIKKFLSENNILIKTNTIQESLNNSQEIVGEENLEKYLLFLIDYAKNEYEKGKIQNLSAFYVANLKKENQIENFMYKLEQDKAVEMKRKKEIEALIELKLKSNYDSFLVTDFHDYIVENIEKIEPTFIKLVKENITGFTFEYVIMRKHKGIIDKRLISESDIGSRSSIIGALQSFREALGYKEITFEEWKSDTVTEELIAELKNEIEKSMK